MCHELDNIISSGTVHEQPIFFLTDRVFPTNFVENGTSYFFASVRGRPRGRSLNSRPMRRAVFFCQRSLPKKPVGETANSNKKEECPLFWCPLFPMNEVDFSAEKPIRSLDPWENTHVGNVTETLNEPKKH
jgi:hypothetical protein